MDFYKFKGFIWMKNGTCEHQQVNFLMQVAANRLRLLEVNHSYFQFFVSHAEVEENTGETIKPGD